jgi:tight adherence protein C
VRRRLDRLGGELTVEQFRAEQLVWGAGGLLTGLVVTLVGTLRLARPNPVPFLLLCTILALAGGLARDRALTRAVSRREQQMLAEFPTVADLLALAITAGESPLAALARVTELCEGELSRELSRALAEARAGASFVNALDGIANRTGLPVLARFVDGVAVAVERGTPLADVLRAQAADVRDASKQALITAGGRKEIAMLVPVVFLVLPLAIVFVVFPGFYGLAVNVP